MDEKTIPILQHLHNLASQRFFQRRMVEWRFAFAFWALTGGIGLAARDLNKGIAVWIVALSGLAAVGFHGTFQWRYSFGPMKRDWDWGIEFERRLREEIGEPTDRIPNADAYKPFWAHGWQVLVTLVVALIVFLSVTFKP